MCGGFVVLRCPCSWCNCTSAIPNVQSRFTVVCSVPPGGAPSARTWAEGSYFLACLDISSMFAIIEFVCAFRRRLLRVVGAPKHRDVDRKIGIIAVEAL